MFLYLTYIHIAPSINTPLEDISTKVGDEVIIKLDISGEPRPDITWFFDSQILADDQYIELEEDTQLVIHNIQAHHSGVYHFTASNSLGTIEGSVRVFVPKELHKEDINFSEPTLDGANNSNYSDVGREVIFEGNKVLLCNWADHVETMSEGHGKGFKNEFQVSATFVL